MALTAQSALTNATGFQILDNLSALQEICYLLSQIAGAPYSTMTAQQILTNANGFQILDDLSALQVACYLLSVIQSAGGGAAVPDAISVPGPPTAVPPSIQNIVVDSAGRQWQYWGGAWH